MDRRSFLIGSGAILTSAYVDKANWFLRNKNAVPPISAVKEASKKLFFVDLQRLDSPNAQAYNYLFDLDLTGEEKGPGPLRGDLDFRMGEVSCGDYLGVLSKDPITASLLRARLIELGHNTSVEIVKDAQDDPAMQYKPTTSVTVYDM